MRIKVVYNHPEKEDIICIFFTRPTDAYDFLRVLLARETDRLLEFKVLWNDDDQGGGDDK